MPELVQLHEEWSPKGVRVQTVALDVTVPKGRVKTAEGIGKFLAAKGFEIPTLAFDGDGTDLAREYGLTGTPLTLAIDGEGRVVDQQLGGATPERFEAMIAKALGE